MSSKRFGRSLGSGRGALGEAAFRSAAAAEGTLKLERERRADEERDRELAAVPGLHAGETTGTVWALVDNELRGVLENDGPGAVTIQSVWLDLGAFGNREGTWDRERAVFGPGELLLVAFPWKAEPDDIDLGVVVQFVAPSRAGYEITFRLHPAGADSAGSRRWRVAAAALRPLG